MSIIGAKGGSAGGYEIANSLRFRASASAYLRRTPASASNRKTWTWSGWVKRANLSSEYGLFSAGQNSASLIDALEFNSSDQIRFYSYSSAYLFHYITTPVYRDSSAWYHIVVAVDTTQATAGNRVKIYVNGVQVTAFGTQIDPTQNSDCYWFNTTNPHALGSTWINYRFLSGYMTEVNFIDGQALTPSSFGEQNSDGVWVPKKYAGTYGTNGFYLDFKDGSTSWSLGRDVVNAIVLSGITCTTTNSSNSVTAITGTTQPQVGQQFQCANVSGGIAYVAAVGGLSGAWTATLDRNASASGSSVSCVFSGNGFSTNALFSLSGVTYDWMTDTPTNNYAVLNPLARGGATAMVLDAANLNWTGSGSAGSPGRVPGSISVSSGKWYFEITRTDALGAGNYVACGVYDTSTALSTGTYSGNPTNTGAASNEWVLTDRGYACNTSTYSNLSGALGTVGQNNVVQVCVDMDAKKIWWGKNNTYSGSPSAGTGEAFSNLPTAVMALAYLGTGTTPAMVANFGQRPFTYTPPTGFKALCTANLPSVTITKPKSHFDVKTWTATTGTDTISGLNFEPDLIWGKNRNTAAIDHHMQARALDAGAVAWRGFLSTNLTNAEADTGGGDYWSVGATSFTVGDSPRSAGANGNTGVAWLWKANGAGSSNTAGSITSTVSANTTAGFSIVTWAGNVTAGATIGHGLGKAPDMIIFKTRGSATDWHTYHSKRTNANTTLMYLNTTSAGGTSTAFLNATYPASTLITLGDSPGTNGSSMVAYCFAEISGYSKFGSYTGNGSADGPFVFCGFRPRWLLFKNASASGDWQLKDTSRSSYNVTNANLYPNLSNAENTAGDIDVTANGFKVRSAGTDVNGSTNTIIFAAFAEHPFGGSNVSPSPAR